MALELQLSRSKYFYGRVNAGGREHFFSLRIPVKGTPPKSMRDLGDALFERQRAKAQAKLDQLSESLRERATREELAQRVLEARTGSRLGSVRLSDMAQKWREIPRSRELALRYVQSCNATLQRFIDFVTSRSPRMMEMNQVDESAAADFMAAEASRGVTGKTYNDVLILLRSCFSRLQKQAGIAENPFAHIPLRETHTVSRIPFTPEEVEQILAAAATEPVVGPLIAVGLSTAMRLGDCAKLRWESVDKEGGFVDVKRTSKTGASISIPLLAPLQKVLEGVSVQKSGYVFPALERLYRVNPTALTDGVRRVFAAAGFSDGDQYSPVTCDREDGVRRASVRDFASLRTTWVTIALNAGVPLELVVKVTGHRTAEMVRKHYHRPMREDFRRAIESKMPAVFVAPSPVSARPVLPQKSALLAAIAALNAMNSDNWQTVRDEVLVTLGRL